MFKLERRWYARNDADHIAYQREREKLNPSKRLLRAIQRGERDTAVFDDLLAQGAILWDRDSESLDPALHLAVIAKNPVALTWLLEHGLPWWVGGLDKSRSMHALAIAKASRGDECWQVLMKWMVESGAFSPAKVELADLLVLLRIVCPYADYARYYRPFTTSNDAIQWHFHPLDIEIDNSSYLEERCQYVYRVDRGSMEVSLITSKTQSAVMAGWETPISRSFAFHSKWLSSFVLCIDTFRSEGVS